MKFNQLRNLDLSRRLRGSNLGLRILAVVLAVGLWVFVNSAERGSVEQLTVPINYSTLPQGMVIVNRPANSVKVEITGPRSLLSLLDPERLTLKIDLRSIAAGQSEFKIYPSMFNVGRNTAVTSISPDSLSLDIDRMVTRDVPVHLAVEDRVAPGYTISSVDITPAQCDRRGAEPLCGAAYLGQHGAVRPERTYFGYQPFGRDHAARSLAGIVYRSRRRAGQCHAGDYRPADSLRGRGQGQRLQVPRRSEASDPDDSRARAKAGGPRLPMASLTSMRGIAPGSHELPLQVELPDGMQVDAPVARKVKLRLYRERLTTAADEHPS